MNHEKAYSPELQAPNCPVEVLETQVLLSVRYWGFDDTAHEGQIVVHRDIEEDANYLFAYMRKAKFPLHSVVPVSHFAWDDSTSMAANNSSAFNYRVIAGTDRLSNHALGRAIDLNPALNPFIRQGRTYPEGATYDVGQPGVLDAKHPVVRAFKRRGFTWGGDWTEPVDYQHFEKP